MNTPSVKPKSFTYHTSLEWKGGKRGILNAEGKPPIDISSPPEFKGEPGRWTPEDLFVASVEMCLMLTFLSLAQRKQLDVKTYTSRAEGLLEFADGGFRFTRITLKPVLSMETGTDPNLVEKTIHDAHQACLISRSMNCEVLVEPSFE